MRFLLEKILYSMKVIGIVNEADEDIYRFGLECVLLEILHYSQLESTALLLAGRLSPYKSTIINAPTSKLAERYYHAFAWLSSQIQQVGLAKVSL